MSEPDAPPQTVAKKRGQGRPVTGENGVGRERLLAATERLLRILPPARVTLSRIAQEADADPALVRYYFGTRAALFLEVVVRVTAHAAHGAVREEAPVPALADHISKTVRFVRSAPFMHRLILDELMEAGSEEARARVTALNRDLVDLYRDLLRADGGEEMVDVDPLFLHVAILGAADFFSSAEPLIRDLLPEGADMEQMGAAFQTFLAKLMLDGLRKR